MTHLEIRVAAYEGDGEILDSACLMCVVELVARLHDVIEGQPFWRIGTSLIDRCRMQAYGLVIDYVSPTLTIADKQLGIKAPCDHRIKGKIVLGIGVIRCRYRNKLPLMRVEPSTRSISNGGGSPNMGFTG